MDSVCTIKKDVYPVVLSVKRAGPEHGLCYIEKKMVSVISVGNNAPVVVMGLKQQPQHGLCFWKPCFAHCYKR